MTGHRRLRPASLLAVALLAAAVAPACSESPTETRSPAALGLSPWVDRARIVFDDNIEPAAVGVAMDVPSARGDKFLRERALTADLVSRLRVQTVTIETVGDDSTYHLGVQVATPTLAPDPRITEKTLELVIRTTTPAYGIAKALDQRMQGLTFIGFISRFASPDGSEVDLHWHLAPDTADVAEAVKEAVALAEASGR